MKAKTLITVLLMSVAAMAQTLVVVDESPSDSPIRIKGTVTYDKSDNATCALTFHNSARKTVVAWRQDVEATFPDHGWTMFNFRHDHFFKDDAMVLAASPQGNRDYDYDNYFDCGIVAHRLWTSQKEPGVSFRTFWVQFADGSTWSDPAHPEAQAYMMAQRVNAVQFLNELKAAYASGGEAAFDETLNSFRRKGATEDETAKRTEAMNTKLDLRDLPNVRAQMAEVYRRLAVASSRANWMK